MKSKAKSDCSERFTSVPSWNQMYYWVYRRLPLSLYLRNRSLNSSISSCPTQHFWIILSLKQLCFSTCLIEHGLRLTDIMGTISTDSEQFRIWILLFKTSNFSSFIIQNCNKLLQIWHFMSLLKFHRGEGLYYFEALQCLAADTSVFFLLCEKWLQQCLQCLNRLMCRQMQSRTALT